MVDPGPSPQIALPATGRLFRGERKVRLGDVTPGGRLRLDALTRYCQDVSDDDTTDAGLDVVPAWVVRRTVVDVLAPATLAEPLTFTTFCSGLGRRWAERRLTISGAGGARYEVATLWICIDAEAGRPHPLTDQFHDIYGPSALGRTVSARPTHPKAPAGLVTTPWPLRAVDFDTLDHVNNAAYWAVVEQWSADGLLPGPDGLARPGLRASIEYRTGIAPGDRVSVGCARHDDTVHLWWQTGDDDPATAATAAIDRFDPEIYAG